MTSSADVGISDTGKINVSDKSMITRNLHLKDSLRMELTAC